MLFNSFHFALFLPVVFIAYWLLLRRNMRAQNILLLVASYYFYACWDWRFLFLLIFSTLLDYYSGRIIEHSTSQKVRRISFWISVVVNLGFLGVFKYYNFFAQSLADGLATVGWQVSPTLLNIILPVGISFYTFHGLSYVVDVYNRRITSERNFIDYAVFVSFFPLLVAGPIERATHLLPQIKSPRQFSFDKSADGMRQILWGLFKKVVIADNCAEFANIAFNNSDQFHGVTLILGACFFAIQIYGDFSGYSDIALGTARLFAIELLRNFAFPYFSRDIAEFWRRWHISLTTWFKDYLYIPLGGSKGTTAMRVRNTFIIFLVSGFWHGANWTFIIWGALNALFFLPLLISNRNRTHVDSVAKNRKLPSVKELLSIASTFALVTLSWIFFRAESVVHAVGYISNIFSDGFVMVKGSDFAGTTLHPFLMLFLLMIFIVIEWVGRESKFALEHLALNWKRPLRYAFYYVLLMTIFLLSGKEQQFIYFQF